jgi:hypothetical protein
MSGLLAAVCLAVFEYPFLYSVLARSYSPGLFFTLLTVAAWTRLVGQYSASQNADRKSKSLFALSLILGVHTHYFAVLMMLLVCMTGFFLIPKGRYASYFLLCLTGAFSFLSELPFFFDLLKVGGLGNWLGKPSPEFLLQFLGTALNGSALAVLTIILVLRIIGGKYTANIRWDNRHTIAFSWFLCSFLVAYIYSMALQPILQPSTLLFAYPFLLLSLFSFATDRPSPFLWRMVPVVALLLLGVYTTFFKRAFHDRPPFGVFKEVAEDLSTWKKESGRLPAVINVVNPDYIGYYFNRLPDAPTEVVFKIESSAELAHLRDMVDTCTADRFAYAWSNNFHPYEIERIIRRRFPRVIAVHHYFNAESWLFARGTDKDGPVPIRQWSEFYNDSTAISAPGLMDFHEGVDYAPDLHDRIAVPDKGLLVLNASVWYRSTDTRGNQVLVFSFDDQGQNIWWESIRLNDFNRKPGAWQQVFLSKPVPAGHDSLDIKVYLWNPEGLRFQVDDLQADLMPAVDPYLRK